jgi:hypothetical protein
VTIDELLKLHEETCQSARDIMRAKNRDYTAGSKDPFANFRASEALGVPGVVSILVRSRVGRRCHPRRCELHDPGARNA